MWWLALPRMAQGVGAGIEHAAETVLDWRHLASGALPRSIVGWFVLCWASFLLAAVAAGALLLSLYSQTTTAQLRRAAAAVKDGCAAIVARAGTAASAGARAGIVHDALASLTGVEGGLWQLGQGSLAYAFPTYEGSGAKTDLPPAEEPQIRSAAEAAARDGTAVERREIGRSQTLLLHACPLPATGDAAAWTMTRVATATGPAMAQAMAGLALLLAVVTGSAAWLGRLLIGWSRQLYRLEAALAASSDTLPVLARTGQRDLDRIVDALNAAGTRLAAARREADLLARQAAEARRLASLGRVVAGVAHEIRNPIAAMRLKAENALAGAERGRKDRALTAIVAQIARLDALLRNLLGSVRHAPPAPEPIADLTRFLEARADLFREQAAVAGVTLAVSSVDAAARFDPARVAQAIDNLTLNAIQNTPPGGQVALRAQCCDGRLWLSVEDTGRGVPPALRDQLFEPFVTGRPEGTGLGLSVVREVAEAHGGTARAVHRPNGTTVVMELPWQTS